jgi:hypothetical protein
MAEHIHIFFLGKLLAIAQQNLLALLTLARWETQIGVSASCTSLLVLVILLEWQHLLLRHLHILSNRKQPQFELLRSSKDSQNEIERMGA